MKDPCDRKGVSDDFRSREIKDPILKRIIAEIVAEFNDKNKGKGPASWEENIRNNSESSGKEK